MPISTVREIARRNYLFARIAPQPATGLRPLGMMQDRGGVEMPPVQCRRQDAPAQRVLRAGRCAMAGQRSCGAERRVRPDYSDVRRIGNDTGR